MNQHLIVVAGGSGQRMQSQIPKQFLELSGKPIIMHTIDQFLKYNPNINIIIVLPEQHISNWKKLIENHPYLIKYQVVYGGDVRFNSVKNGLNLLPNNGFVAVHDGVRPLVSQETITTCFIEAEIYGNAIPCVPVYETVRRIKGDISIPEDRSVLRLVQTPQIFNINLLKKAYEQPFKSEFTDDASVLESLGEQIHLVEGNRENIKITDPLDLLVAQTLINTLLK